jgi:hypothetical protein
MHFGDISESIKGSLATCGKLTHCILSAKTQTYFDISSDLRQPLFDLHWHEISIFSFSQIDVERSKW